ncbi:MAG: bifunctional DNA primase/polymerase [Acidimicrobiia bacterium]
MINAVLRYVDVGWSVFPLHWLEDSGRCSCRADDCGSPGKHPRTPHGVDDATTSKLKVNAWWRQWPTANIGIACGPSCLVVIDVDLHKPEALDSFRRLLAGGYRLPPTIAQITGSGGCHYLYKAPEWDLRNSSGRLVGVPFPLPGIDLRARGGYVLVAPSRTTGRYEKVRSRVKAPAPCPSWLRVEDTPAAPNKVVTPARSGRYGQVALERIAGELAGTPEGQRNTALNTAAYQVGKLAARGELDRDSALNQLERTAHQLGLGPKETATTIVSGYRAGYGSGR